MASKSEVSADEIKVGQRFSVSVCSMGEIDAYWSRGKFQIYFRAVQRKNKMKSLPHDAVLIGRYMAPCKRVDFLEDLRVVMADEMRAYADAIGLGMP